MSADTATAEQADRQTPRLGPTRGEVISALSALVLLVLMFAAAWYGVDRIPRATGTSSAAASAENAWHALGVIRWMMLLTVLLAFAAFAIHTRHPSRVVVARVRLALLALSTVTAAAVIFRVLIRLPSSDRVVDQKLGAVLGVLAALGIAYGAYEAVREQRARLFGLAPRGRDSIASGRSRR
jgi:formate hydrogenlyase subunit 3/multisubunit Na+/H+ antiporter MnhD subunit